MSYFDGEQATIYFAHGISDAISPSPPPITISPLRHISIILPPFIAL
jgi:hypothetical protein